MDPACLPPEGSARRSAHWLEHGPSKRLCVMEWCDPVWFAIADPCERYPHDLAAKGYCYVAPCTPPAWHSAAAKDGS